MSLALFSFLDTEQNVVYECRRCGATLDGPDASCPFGCAADVVRYDL